MLSPIRNLTRVAIAAALPLVGVTATSGEANAAPWIRVHLRMVACDPSAYQTGNADNE